jgi:hemin uptake protein HemP
VSERATEAAAEPRQPVRAVESSALFAGGRELVIRHAGSEYRLRITRTDKLILTK